MTRSYLPELKRAGACLDNDRLDEARAILESLYAMAPLDPYVLYNYGLLHTKCGQMDAAISLYRRAVGADPGLVPALLNLCNSLLDRGDHREALRYGQMALRRNPRHPQIYHSLAIALMNIGEAKDALEAASDGLRFDPQHIGLLVQQMAALNELGRTQEAYEAALRIIIHPQGANHFDTYVFIVNYAAKHSDWETVERYTPKFLELARKPEVDLNPMQLAFHCDDPALIAETAHRRVKKLTPPPTMPRRRPDGRIVVAYLSPDLREHPVAHMLLDVLPHHDRSAFSVYTVGTLPNDISPLSTEIARYTDGHIDLTRLDDSAAALELRRLNVDVLIDLAGSTKWCRPGLLARRACPVQVLWLGCPCTTGTPYYDAYLVDDVVAPPGYEAYCTEPLVRLPCCYHPISTGHGLINPNLTRKNYRLPSDRTIVGMLQQPNKIRPPLIDRVARAMAPHANTDLWIRIHPTSADTARERIASNGLPGNRVHICPIIPQREHYLSMWRMVDVAVDSFPYGGHSTTGEALIQGTPVLTMAGRSIHTRVAASMMQEMGIGDLVLQDLDQLEQTLHELLTEPERLRALKERFLDAAKAYRTHGAQRLATALENAYRNLLSQVPTAA